MEDKQIKEEHCVELKNIQYQTMLLNKNTNNSNELRPTSKGEYTLNQLNNILDNEKKITTKLPWSRLTKGKKLEKIMEYIQLVKEKHNMTNKEFQEMKSYIKKCFERKLLQTAKIISFDKEKQTITNIPGLIIHDLDYIKSNSNKKRFTLKLGANKTSTLKNLSKGKSSSRSQLVEDMRNSN